jgi:predicted DNA binding CopG/RHH family protein
MKKKRIAKRAGRKVRVRAKVSRSVMTPVTVTLPSHLCEFLKGAAARTSLPVETIVRSLLAVQVHAMCGQEGRP